MQRPNEVDGPCLDAQFNLFLDTFVNPFENEPPIDAREQQTERHNAYAVSEVHKYPQMDMWPENMNSNRGQEEGELCEDTACMLPRHII